MLNGLYDDVTSIMSRNGFVDWFERNKRGTVSPLKWCYGEGCQLKPISTPPTNISWLIQTYDSFLYIPRDLMIDDCGDVRPRE